MRNSLYVLTKMQGGTERLAEALQLRGFSVEMEDDCICLKNGTVRDREELKFFLDKLNIPVYWHREDSFQLLVNRFPIQMMKKIIQCDGRDYPFSVAGYQLRWRNFVTRRYGICTETLQLCPFTAVLLKALNEVGIVTVACCNGHKRHQPNFQFSGLFNGLWFKFVQAQYLNELILHYNWKVEFVYGNRSTALVAHKSASENWNMMKVLADCEQMAKTLRKSAKEIRYLKRASFKRSMKETAEAFVDANDMKGLYDWMKQQVEKRINEQSKASGRHVLRREDECANF
ncbi:MAG TPA: hypothetical protein VK029_00350 [Pseudogracilibacillus sp.]|nr:hypothetical protein [Pseudogracilibacillus sp.]